MLADKSAAELCQLQKTPAVIRSSTHVEELCPDRIAALQNWLLWQNSILAMHELQMMSLLLPDIIFEIRATHISSLVCRPFLFPRFAVSSRSCCCFIKATLSASISWHQAPEAPTTSHRAEHRNRLRCRRLYLRRCCPFPPRIERRAGLRVSIANLHQ